MNSFKMRQILTAMLTISTVAITHSSIHAMNENESVPTKRVSKKKSADPNMITGELFDAVTGGVSGVNEQEKNKVKRKQQQKFEEKNLADGDSIVIEEKKGRNNTAKRNVKEDLENQSYKKHKAQSSGDESYGHSHKMQDAEKMLKEAQKAKEEADELVKTAKEQEKLAQELMQEALKQKKEADQLKQEVDEKEEALRKLQHDTEKLQHDTEKEREEAEALKQEAQGEKDKANLLVKEAEGKEKKAADFLNSVEEMRKKAADELDKAAAKQTEVANMLRKAKNQEAEVKRLLEEAKNDKEAAERIKQEAIELKKNIEEREAALREQELQAKILALFDEMSSSNRGLAEEFRELCEKHIHLQDAGKRTLAVGAWLAAAAVVSVHFLLNGTNVQTLIEFMESFWNYLGFTSMTGAFGYTCIDYKPFYHWISAHKNELLQLARGCVSSKFNDFKAMVLNGIKNKKEALMNAVKNVINN